ncbi:MAG: binding-protein-dependent transport system inner rane component [Blastococcus sp.]|jgi:oligopeptide transport system permease protein|nr:binding-protein-dependent transport system inner rane component [Blastococcus sp.]
MSETALRAAQTRFVADLEETPLATTDQVDESTPPGGLWLEAWRTLRRRPLFIISSVIILFLIVLALFPGLFATQDPTHCELQNSLLGSTSGHPFGFDVQGCDIYSRVVYGARASVSVGVLSTAITVLVGGVIGALAGFYGGWLDAVLARLTDIFFSVPLLLGAITCMQAFPDKTVWVVALVLAVFGWPQVARIMRGSVLSVRNAEYVTAATALGASRAKNLLRHVLPNAIAPVIVIATVSLGAFIGAEATLSFLGIGLNPATTVSWGGDINQAQNVLRSNPSVLLYPAAALSLTVLSFIMLGDAVREALDPKSRKR